jgi:hypothetical protein
MGWWTLEREGTLVRIACGGHMAANDAIGLCEAAGRELDMQPLAFEVDLREVRSYDEIGTMIAKARIGPRRHRVLHVTIIGGSVAGRIACALVAVLLRYPIKLRDAPLEPREHPAPAG